MANAPFCGKCWLRHYPEANCPRPDKISDLINRVEKLEREVRKILIELRRRAKEG